ncbi:MAG TPA: hypothetical protein VMS98_02635 [Thermoanaerobaculia bacterium]|nr:hypothetical protein [Thermoanaerobaculia bacterium]
MLRVYSLEIDRADAAVRITVAIRDDDRIPHTRVVTDVTVPLSARQRILTGIADSGERGSLPIRPLAADLSLDGIVAAALPPASQFTVTVTPLVDNLPIWAFVSETDNGTQRVQIVLPQ